MTDRPPAGTISPTRKYGGNRPDIKLAIKQLLVRALLALLYGLIRLKRLTLRLMKAVATPLRLAGRFVLRTVGIPLYRLTFFLKRHTGRLLAPAKNRLTFFVSNRYSIHVAVAILVAVTGVSNLRGSEVRAETFGTGSMLYALVAPDAASSVEVVSASVDPGPSVSSYLDDSGVIDPHAHVDFTSPDTDYATTTVGGSSVSSPAIHENEPAATRTATESYQVADGDTLYGISGKFDLSLSSLLWANGMTVRSVIRPGDTLKIPPADGVTYAVKKGDTVGKIAATYGSEADKIIAFNHLADAGDLKVGEELFIPDGEPPTPVAAAPRRPASVTQIFTAPVVNDKQTSKWTKTPGHALTGPTTTRTAALTGFEGGSGTWVWPTDWHVITQYFGWKHTGVDIDGDYSTHSYAAADGVVIYAGWRNGYGNTVEVDHGNGIVTRYGHHSKIFVKVGQSVKAGELLAQTGSTGNSTGTHLHFEVIKNGKFQNPLDYVR